MRRSPNNPWLHRFAVFTAVATLFLICVGGLVTSKGVGLAVPDWPTTYGYNMFFFPLSKWVGGVFYEHSHRLVASAVGMLTTILAVWLWLKEERKWLRWLGVAGFWAIVGQGVLGGLRVTALKDELGIFHAMLAQVFFVLISAIALFTSQWWLGREGSRRHMEEEFSSVPRRLRDLYVVITGLIFLQLIIGATMRHQHAGLAIPDFPMAYGKVWPDMDADAIMRYNQTRLETTAAHPITASGVALQVVHRMLAGAIFLSVAFASWKTLRHFAVGSLLGRLAILWMSLIVIQVGLGAATVWTNKSADIATAHVAVGALSLMIGAMLVLTTPLSFSIPPRFPERVRSTPRPTGVTAMI